MFKGRFGNFLFEILHSPKKDDKEVTSLSVSFLRIVIDHVQTQLSSGIQLTCSSLASVHSSLLVWVLTLQADHFSKRGKTLPQQDSVELELAEEKPVKRSLITVEELTEIERLEDLDTCMVRHFLWRHRYPIQWMCYFFFFLNPNLCKPDQVKLARRDGSFRNLLLYDVS